MTSALRPSMTSEVGRDLDSLVHIVDLSVFCEQVIVGVFLNVFESVAGTRQQQRTTFS